MLRLGAKDTKIYRVTEGQERTGNEMARIYPVIILLEITTLYHLVSVSTLKIQERPSPSEYHGTPGSRVLRSRSGT